jgi:two-component system nitrate/nitrite response regulator NarL
MSLATLSLREWEVARLAFIGMSNKAIAHTLNVAEGTVKVHLHNLMQQLGTKNRTALAAIILAPVSGSVATANAGRAGSLPELGQWQRAEVSDLDTQMRAQQ